MIFDYAEVYANDDLILLVYMSISDHNDREDEIIYNQTCERMHLKERVKINAVIIRVES